MHDIKAYHHIYFSPQRGGKTPPMTSILLVDDHEIVRDAVQATVHQLFPQARIYHAGTIRETRQLLKQHRPRMLVLDINIPDGNGVELIQLITKQHLETHVLVFSGMNLEEYGVAAIQAGACGAIGKDQPTAEFKKALQMTYQGKRYIPEVVARRLLESIGQKEVSTPHLNLSTREMEIMTMIASGGTVKHIAYTLGISDKTVSTYLARIYEKMGLHSHVEITRYALHHGLVD